jgi:phosphoribosyl 1,2-cyclic phosphate phosphodiesterase
VRPRRAYLVHLSHETSHADAERLLPKGIKVAWDGLVVSTGDR